MESSIPTLREKYNRIRQRQSFSFQKKKTGTAWRMKVLLLITVVAVLTWYGKQETNNPFSPRNTITVSGNRSGLVVYLHRQYRKSGYHLAVAQGTVTMPHGGEISFPQEKWDLVSDTDAIGFFDRYPPPQSWYVLSDSGTPAAKSEWPIPQQLGDTAIGSVTFKRVHPFHDQRTALLLEFSDASFLLVDGTTFACTPSDTTKFKEKLDFLVITDAAPGTIIDYRSVFRPQYTIVSGSPDTTLPTFSNLFHLSSEKLQSHSFKITRTGIKEIVADAQR
ncbi:MAG: hypothetical protein JW863_15405 [Chitinispirillaceae bacterium]|nr:hypothetical protein [Chitinispirillaceae bacterium]